MDVVSVLQPFFDFFISYCNTTLSFGGYSFTIGALFIWSVLAVVVIGFVKGLAG